MALYGDSLSVGGTVRAQFSRQRRELDWSCQLCAVLRNAQSQPNTDKHRYRFGSYGSSWRFRRNALRLRSDSNRHSVQTVFQDYCAGSAFCAVHDARDRHDLSLWEQRDCHYGIVRLFSGNRHRAVRAGGNCSVGTVLCISQGGADHDDRV